MALTDNLVSYWNLDEESGTRVDAHGSNDLTDYNSVGYSAEAWGNAADFERDNTQYLEKTGGYAAGLSPASGDYSVSAWIKLESALGTYQGRAICAVGANWNLVYTNQDLPTCFALIRWVGSWNTHTFSCTLTAGVVYHLVMTWEHATHTATFYLNGAVGGADSSGTTASQPTWNDPFWIGRNNYGSYFDGVIGRVGFWSRKLTSDEVATLYNSGTPLAYPFATNAAIPVFVNQYRQRRA